MSRIPNIFIFVDDDALDTAQRMRLDKRSRMSTLVGDIFKYVLVPYLTKFEHGYIEVDGVGNQYTLNMAGQKHSFGDEPSARLVDGTREWHDKGRLHREGRPAIITGGRDQLYYTFGTLTYDSASERVRISSEGRSASVLVDSFDGLTNMTVECHDCASGKAFQLNENIDNEIYHDWVMKTCVNGQSGTLLFD